MRRRLLNVLTVLLLLAAAGVAAAWVRGHFAGDVVRYITGGTSRADQANWCFAHGGGGLAFVLVRGSGSDVNRADDGEPLGFHWRTVAPRYAANRWWGDSAWNRTGFYGFNDPGNAYAGRVEIRGVVAPAWFLLLLATVLPAARVARRVRRRHAPGTCPRCGYDLRGTPDRCPECGTTASVSAIA